MIEIHRLGVAVYAEVLELQREAQRKVIAGEIPEQLFACEHPPTLTLGTSFKESSLRVPREAIEASGVKIFTVERGGDVTYHGPGQVILYPILDLRKRKTDIGWYMRGLEQSVIDTIQEFGLTGERSCKNPGVWIKEKKIASCGVKLSRWCTMHGIALNVSNASLAGFQKIEPCGLTGTEMTCVEELVDYEIDLESVKNRMLIHFTKVFE